jgi:hypothetical protein
MPNECRQIEFDRGELLEALTSYLGKPAEPSHPSVKADVRVTDKPRPSVNYVLLDEFERETRASEIEPAAIAAALIKYCIAHKIPIPRKFAKSIQIRGGSVVLMLRSAA